MMIRIVIDYTGTQHDGTRCRVPGGRIIDLTMNTPDGQHLTVRMVPTGLVQWHGDTPAEVYVPEHRLQAYLLEHDLDGTG